MDEDPDPSSNSPVYTERQVAIHLAAQNLQRIDPQLDPVSLGCLLDDIAFTFKKQTNLSWEKTELFMTLMRFLLKDVVHMEVDGCKTFAGVVQRLKPDFSRFYERYFVCTHSLCQHVHKETDLIDPQTHHPFLHHESQRPMTRCNGYQPKLTKNSKRERCGADLFKKKTLYDSSVKYVPSIVFIVFDFAEMMQQLLLQPGFLFEVRDRWKTMRPMADNVLDDVIFSPIWERFQYVTNENGEKVPFLASTNKLELNMLLLWSFDHFPWFSTSKRKTGTGTWIILTLMPWLRSLPEYMYVFIISV